MADSWRPWYMLLVKGQCHLPYAHMPYPCLQDLDDSAFHLPTLLGRYTYSMVVLAWLCWSPMALVDVPWQIHTCHVRCMHFFANTTFLFSDLNKSLYVGYKQATSEVARQIWESYDDVWRPCLMSEDQWVQDTYDAIRNLLASANQCVHSVGNGYSPWPTLANHCIHSKGNAGIWNPK